MNDIQLRYEIKLIVAYLQNGMPPDQQMTPIEWREVADGLFQETKLGRLDSLLEAILTDESVQIQPTRLHFRLGAQQRLRSKRRKI